MSALLSNRTCISAYQYVCLSVRLSDCFFPSNTTDRHLRPERSCRQIGKSRTSCKRLYQPICESFISVKLLRSAPPRLLSHHRRRLPLKICVRRQFQLSRQTLLHPLVARICATVRLSVRPSVRRSVHRSVGPSVRLSVRRSVRSAVRPSVRPAVCPSVQPSVNPSVRPYVLSSDRPTHRPFVSPSVANFVQV